MIRLREGRDTVLFVCLCVFFCISTFSGVEDMYPFITFKIICNPPKLRIIRLEKGSMTQNSWIHICSDRTKDLTTSHGEKSGAWCFLFIYSSAKMEVCSLVAGYDTV